MNKIREWLSHNWWWFVPVLLSVALMLPRLASPQFGVEDDGASIARARQMLAGTWTPSDDAGAGRFRPLYWASFALVYALAGQRPFWFFFYNMLILAGICVLLMHLARRRGLTRLQAFLVGGLFAVSGPIVESFYTLTKIEPLQLLLILAAIAIALHTGGGQRILARVVSIGLLVLMALLAFLSKETTLVMIPIALGWLLLGLVFRVGRQERGRLILLLAGFLIAALGFWLLREHFLVSRGPGYASQYRLSLGQMVLTGYRWGGWLIRDFPYIAICVIFLIWQLLSRKAGSGRDLLLGSAVWMAGWMAIFLPWIYTVEYYMLPFAAGAAIFCGPLIGDMLVALRSPARGQARVGAVCLGLVLLLFATTLSNDYSNARLQMVIDAQNSALLDSIAASVPPNGRVLVNLGRSNAYIGHIQRHLQIVRGRTDLTILAFSPDEARPKDFVLTLRLANQPMFFVRLGTEQASAKQLNARLKEFLGPLVQPIFQTRSSYRQLDINLVRLACLFTRLGFCQENIPLVDTRPLEYGGAIYQVP